MEDSPISQRLTSRFVAGSTLDSGIEALRRLAKQNIWGTLDFLGENVTSVEEAQHSRDAYLTALAQIRGNQLPATLSIKLSQFGIDLSPDACLANVSALVQEAARAGTRIEIDMESSDYTDRTIDVVTDMQFRFPGHVRAVIQAYLFRSETDIENLSGLKIPVRLCKGAYREPPNVAFASKSDVDRNYVKLATQLLESGTYPAIASHDEAIVLDLLRYVRERKIPADRFEFQMLYGIRRDLQRKLTADGFRLRLYVPYGYAWYPYFMRRLAERPANVLFLAKNLIRS